MTDREKLINLILKISDGKLIYGKEETINITENLGELIDRLLSGGVTVKEPIRPMTKAELVHLPDDPVVYLEFANGLIIPKIIMRYSRGRDYGYMHWTDGHRSDMLDYGITWRLLDRKAHGGRKEGCGMGKMNFVEWLREESKRDEICAPCLPADKAVNFLCNYLLGEDWYCVMPIHAEQVNTEIVHEILMKYSRRYRKEYKRAVREMR